MTTNVPRPFRPARIAAIGFALAAPASTLAESVPPEALHVTVLADRYVTAGRPFADVAGLEAWARPILIRTLWLDSCVGSSTKPLLAAVERFHSAYPEGIRIRTFDARGPVCVAAATSTSRARIDRTLSVPTDYLATDDRGRSLMP